MLKKYHIFHLYIHILISFSTPVPWDLHLNFCFKMIKWNLERHNWRRMHKKCLKAFVDFWVAVFIYKYIYIYIYIYVYIYIIYTFIFIFIYIYYIYILCMYIYIYIYIHTYIYNIEKRELLVVKGNFSQLVLAIGQKLNWKIYIFWSDILI